MFRRFLITTTLPSYPLFTTLRFQSSSSQNTTAVIKNLHDSIRSLQNTTNAKWIVLRNIAQNFDEDLLENVSEEYGGLKQFVEQCAEAKSQFKIRQNPETKAFEIRSSFQQPQQQQHQKQQQKVQQQQGKETQSPSVDLWTELAAAPPPPSPSDSANNTSPQQQTNNNYNSSELFKEQQRRKQNDAMQQMIQVEREREIVKCVPSYGVPLKDVVALHNTNQRKSLNCREYLKFLKDQECSHLLSIFFPYDASIIAENKISIFDTLLNESATSLDDLENFCFISILPPFVSSHLNQETDDLLAESCRVADYDMCRLARYLSNDNFVTISSLLNSNVPSLLQKPLMHVVAAFPNHFEYVPPNGKLPDDANFVTDVESSCKNSDEKGCPAVYSFLVGNKPLSEQKIPGFDDDDVEEGSASTKDNTQKEAKEEEEKTKVSAPETSSTSSSTTKRDFGSVRFILTPSELEKCLGGLKPTIRVLNFSQLTELRKLISGSGKNADPQLLLEKGLEFGFGKAIPSGVKRVQMKHQVTRALIRMRFPRGNPFFDRDVFAHYLFDILPPQEIVSLNDIRLQSLPESGRTAAPMSSAYLASYPHLFRLYQDVKLNLYCQRADSEAQVGAIRRESITDKDILDAIWIAKPNNFAIGSKSAGSSVTLRMPLTILNEIKAKYGTINEFVKKYPENFEVAESEYFYWKKEPEDLAVTRLQGEALYVVE